MVNRKTQKTQKPPEVLSRFSRLRGESRRRLLARAEKARAEKAEAKVAELEGVVQSWIDHTGCATPKAYTVELLGYDPDPAPRPAPTHKCTDHAAVWGYGSHTNPCSSRAVCEFGQYGCEAEYWGTEHNFVGCLLICSKCHRLQALDDPDVPDDYCQFGDGGVYGMCGHRPRTAVELRRTHRYMRGDKMGERPAIDLVNVTHCDASREGKAQ